MNLSICDQFSYSATEIVFLNLDELLSLAGGCGRLFNMLLISNELESIIVRLEDSENWDGVILDFRMTIRDGIWWRIVDFGAFPVFFWRKDVALSDRIVVGRILLFEMQNNNLVFIGAQGEKTVHSLSCAIVHDVEEMVENV